MTTRLRMIWNFEQRHRVLKNGYVLAKLGESSAFPKSCRFDTLGIGAQYVTCSLVLYGHQFILRVLKNLSEGKEPTFLLVLPWYTLYFVLEGCNDSDDVQ